MSIKYYCKSTLMIVSLIPLSSPNTPEHNQRQHHNDQNDKDDNYNSNNARVGVCIDI